uniref:Zinc finger MYM-type protein 4 n=1 Tax=Astyanax mexicanus TaxID=7994 RepID=A0A8B9K5K1_ASTMX
MDEEYEKALALQDPPSKIKDEPDTSEECIQKPEEEFKISAVFSVGKNPASSGTSSTSTKSTTNSPAPALTPASSLCVVCSGCKKVLLKGQTAFQRKGSPQLYCSPQCLCTTATDLMTKSIPKKTCHYCLREISNPKDVIIAPVDSAGAVKDFCSQKCLSAFNFKRDSAKASLGGSSKSTKCSMCQKACTTRHEVNFLGSVHKLCSDFCFNQFRSSNKLTMNCCVQCGGYCYSGDGQCHCMVVEGTVKKFCNQNCVSVYKKKYGKPVSCTMCRGYHSMQEMVENINTEGSRELFCSTACVTAYKVQSVSSSGMYIFKECWEAAIQFLSLYCQNVTLNIFCLWFSFLLHIKVLQWNATTASSLMCLSTTLPCQIVRSATSAPYLVWCPFRYATLQTSSAPKLASTKPVSAEPSSSGAPQIPAVTKIPCAQCQRSFFRKPELLDFKGKMYVFCDKSCIDEFRRTNYIMAQCVYCKIDKVVKEIKRINNTDCSFCSEGCKLLYKHDLVKRWGKKHCRNCLYCSGTSQTLVTSVFSGKQEEFCGNECLSQYTLLFCQVAKCSMCKRAKKMVESVKWLGEKKHFCITQGKAEEGNILGTALAFLRISTTPVLQPDTPVIANVISLSNATNGQPNVLGSAALQGAVPSCVKLIGHASTQTDALKIPSAPTPRLLKNKALLCKPMSQNKGTSCKPNTCDVNLQTDIASPDILVLPIPVPVYVPVPMNLYTQFTPHAMGLPLPVPVPMFLPTTLDSAEKIVETIQKIKEKIPDDPLEADLIMMAEMVAEDNEKDKTVSHGGKQIGVLLNTVYIHTHTARKRTGGSPRSPSNLPNVSKLHHEYGVQAWKSWIRWRNSQPNIEVPKMGCKSDFIELYSTTMFCLLVVFHSIISSRNMMLKEDMLQCSTAELSYGLCKFISEARRPNGEMYRPDSIHYLCLGIQQHLFENGRMENIFADLFYSKFSQSINTLLKDWKPTIMPSGYVHSRVEEEYLWQCKQLGAFSPSVLLNTLLYFCTKFFNFKTVAQHRRLSFAHVMRCTRSHGNSKTACLRFYPPVPKEEEVPAKRKREDEEDEGVVMEMQENAGNPLRCPVRLYEFYLSKCSSSVKQRTNIFYLRPERSCIPNSPLWFSSSALDDEELDIMLTRILTVRELYLEREIPASVSDSENITDSD